MAKVDRTKWRPDDVAVIGLACRFPGTASDEKKLWKLLAERKSAHSKVPKARYNVDAFHQRGATHPDNLAADGAHFLEQDASSFDAPFFGITADEAKAMDPQARMLLECSFEALENAGLSVDSVAGTETGCYVGCFTRDYHELLMSDVECSPRYPVTGTGLSLLSNRLSWFYDLKGPSLSLDTACSSSLVGLHLACQSLKLGESKMAMVCGANLLLAPNFGLWLSKLNMLSSEGLSRSFGEGVSGYGRGEGIATVILKPLADAIRDGDTIRAVIKGTGVNQDGHTKGITVPNPQAQSALINSTYRAAGLDFADTGYFEAHGTGTAVGDPLELAALKQVMRDSKRTTPLLVGSIKSNIGHLEGAAGLAGLIKCILMLEKGTVLPNIHFERPNERISFEHIQVPTTVMPWPEGVKRLASVNSFGYGGTNAHAIVEAFHSSSEQHQRIDLPNVSVDDDDTEEARPRRLFILTGHEQSTVQEMRARLLSYVLEQEEIAVRPNGKFDDLSFTLGSRRSKLDWAVSHVASSFSELREKLSDTRVKATRSSNKARVGFVFTGQGAQWPRMGLGLMKYAAFRDSVRAADGFLSQQPDCHWSVLEELEKHDAESRVKTSELSQPLCTIIQVAMVDLLRSWNVQPVAAVGHSSGEIAAAYCTGAITKETAWQVAFHRGRHCADLRTQAPNVRGAMLAVGLGPQAVKPYIDAFEPGHINVACVNSPNSVTVSGDASEVRELLARLSADKIFARELQVENAYHSHHMEVVAQPYLRSIADVAGAAAKDGSISTGIEMTSSVTGQLARPSDLSPEYWVRNLVSPVLFADAVVAMLRKPSRGVRQRRKAEPAVDFLLEVGPHAALRGPLSEILKSEALQGVGYASMLLRGRDAVETAMTAAADLYCNGCPVDVTAVNDFQHDARVLVDLPAYPWNRSNKYWATSRLTENYLHRTFPHHSLLGKRLAGSDALDPAWRHFLDLDENPWIRDHVVHGAVIYPGAGFLVMAIEAVLQLAQPDDEVANVKLRDVRIVKALVVKEYEDHAELITRFRRVERGPESGEWSGWWEFAISCARGHGEPVKHATGQIMVEYSPREPFLKTASALVHEAKKNEYKSLADVLTDKMEQRAFYRASEDIGLAYGAEFQGIVTMARGTDRCCWNIELTDRSSSTSGVFESKHLIHPTTLDAIMHSLFGAMNEGQIFQSAALPVAFDSVTISSKMPADAGVSLSGLTLTRRAKEREIVADIYVSSGDWARPLVQMEGLRCTELPAQDTTPAVSRVQSAPLGTVTYRPDIDLLDERGLMSYITENYERASHGESDPTLYSGRLRNAVAQVVDLAAFKRPALSVLQIGGFDQGVTSSLMSALEAGACGQGVTAKILVLGPEEDMLARAKAELGSNSSAVDALRLDRTKPLSSQIGYRTAFDVLLVTIEPDLEIEAKRLFLTQARALLRAGGIFVVFDTLLNIKDNPTLYDFHNDEKGIQDHPRTWQSFTIEDPPCQKAAAVSMQKVGSDPTALSRLPICILQPPSGIKNVRDTVKTLENLLCAHHTQVTVHTWPPSIDEVKGKFVISLLDMDQPFLCSLDAANFSMIQQVALQSERLLWVCPNDNPHTAVAIGWLRVLQNENPDRCYQYLAVETNGAEESRVDWGLTVAKVAMAETEEREFSQQDGCLEIPRWTYDHEMTRTITDSVQSCQSDSAQLGGVESDTPLRLAHGGDLEYAHFVPDTVANTHLAADEVEVELHFVNIGQCDVSDSTTPAPREASGLIRSVGSKVSLLHPGDRVCLSFVGHLSTRVISKASLCQKIPPQVNMNEAACLPVTFATAVRALVDVAGVKEQQNVLIQAGGTKIGRAAVLLAAASKAVVYATARHAEDVGLLESLGLPKDNILIEGDPLFSQATMVLTEQRGWDVIVRTARTSDGMRVISETAASSGVVIDVSMTGDLDEAREATISVVGIGSLLPEDPVLMQKTIARVGDFLPQLSALAASFDVFPSSAATDALKHHRTHGTRSGTMLSFDREDTIRVSPSVKNTVKLHGESTYVLAGGLGGLGRSLARLMVDNGARNLVFLSRSGPESRAAKALLREMMDLGARVKSLACDVSDEASVAGALQDCARTMPPIRGVIQAATVVWDAIYYNYTFEQWEANIKPKVQGSWNLHCQLPEDMDFFVMLSSIAGLIGHRSQAGYAAGNTFQDAIALHRQRQGLPGVAVDLGAMLDVGAIKDGITAANLSVSEATYMKEAELHSIMTMCLSGGIGEYTTPSQVCTGIPSGGMLQRGRHEAPLHFERPFFAVLKNLGTTTATSEDKAASVDAVTELIARLKSSASLDDAQNLAVEILRARLAKDIQCAADDIDPTRPLTKYGIDSLVAVDWRSWARKDIKADVSPFDILSARSIHELASKIAKTSALVPDNIRKVE